MGVQLEERVGHAMQEERFRFCSCCNHGFWLSNNTASHKQNMIFKQRWAWTGRKNIFHLIYKIIYFISWMSWSQKKHMDIHVHTLSGPPSINNHPNTEKLKSGRVLLYFHQLQKGHLVDAWWQECQILSEALRPLKPVGFPPWSATPEYTLTMPHFMTTTKAQFCYGTLGYIAILILKVLLIAFGKLY